MRPDESPSRPDCDGDDEDAVCSERKENHLVAWM